MSQSPPGPEGQGAPQQDHPAPESPSEPTAPAPPAYIPDTAESRHDRWAHRRAEPRPLALLWTTFLAGATVIMLTSLVMHGGADHEIYRPAARGLLAVTAVGMTILWPMIRLSQTRPPESAASAVAKDLVVILAPVQAILWPQMFFVLANWPFEVIAALSVMLLVWNLLIGAVVVLAIDSAGSDTGRSGLVRAAWMAAIIALVCLGPVIGLFTRTGLRPWPDDPSLVSPWALTSPLTSIFEIARNRPWSGTSGQALPAHWTAIGIVGGLAALAWAAVLAAPRRIPAAPPTGDRPVGVV